MRVLVCGGRDYADHDAVYRELDKLCLKLKADEEIVVIEGGAKGADRLARDWARVAYVGVITVEADWEKHGRAAGPLRNTEMLVRAKPDLVLAFPGGNGLEGGTGDMVKQALRANVAVNVIGLTGEQKVGLFT